MALPRKSTLAAALLAFAALPLMNFLLRAPTRPPATQAMFVSNELATVSVQPSMETDSRMLKVFFKSYTCVAREHVLIIIFNLTACYYMCFRFVALHPSFLMVL